MDPLTHGLLGAAAAHLAFGHKFGRHAWWVGFCAAVLPDADVFLPFGDDPIGALTSHRGFTHALFFVPTGGLIAALLVGWLPAFRGKRHELLGACMLAWLTHPVCDAWTSYGTVLFWPVSDMRVSWDAMSIIDPVFTLVLLVGLAWAVAAKARKPAAIGLAVALVYVGLGFVQHARAVGEARRLAAERGHAVEHLRVMPTPANLVLWRSVYIAGDGRMYADAVRVAPLGGVTHRAGESLPVLDLAGIETGDEQADGDLRRFAWFADGFTAMLPGHEDVVGDMRYSLDPAAFEPIWGVRVEEFGIVPVDIEAPGGGLRAALEEVWWQVLHGLHEAPSVRVVVPER